MRERMGGGGSWMILVILVTISEFIENLIDKLDNRSKSQRL